MRGRRLCRLADIATYSVAIGLYFTGATGTIFLCFWPAMRVTMPRIVRRSLHHAVFKTWGKRAAGHTRLLGHSLQAPGRARFFVQRRLALYLEASFPKIISERTHHVPRQYRHQPSARSCPHCLECSAGRSVRGLNYAGLPLTALRSALAACVPCQRPPI